MQAKCKLFATEKVQHPNHSLLFVVCKIPLANANWVRSENMPKIIKRKRLGLLWWWNAIISNQRSQPFWWCTSQQQSNPLISHNPHPRLDFTFLWPQRRPPNPVDKPPTDKQFNRDRQSVINSTIWSLSFLIEANLRQLIPKSHPHLSIVCVRPSNGTHRSNYAIKLHSLCRI